MKKKFDLRRAPNPIDISLGSLQLFRETAQFSRLLRHTGDTEDTFST